MAKTSIDAASPESIANRKDELVRVLNTLKQPAPPWLDQELTFSQFRVLYLLSEQGPITMSRLAEVLDVTPATATGVIERLEKRGLAERSHRGDDRRVVECSLSEAGQQMVGAATGARLDQMRHWLSVLEPDELGQLDRLLSNVIDRLTHR